jgi:hypothetical protein
LRRALYEMFGLLLVIASVVFFYFSVKFLGERDYIAGLLQIFVGFALIRAGLELTKLGILTAENSE